MTVRLLTGDCRAILPTLAADSFDCIVTSPPYWGLRDYGTASWEGGDADCDHSLVRRNHGEHEKQATSAGTSRDRIVGMDCPKCGARRIDAQIGLEPTLDAYVETMAGVAHELWRVLKSSGTFWLNLGDSYAGGGGFSPTAPSNAWSKAGQRGERCLKSGGIKPQGGLKAKDLCLVPVRVALRLQADGWWLRSKIIWAKPSPMPESVRDRPTSSYEEVFLLTKSERYFYDADAIRETCSDTSHGSPNVNAGWKNVVRGDAGSLGKFTAEDKLNGRNARNVWTIATQPYSGAHFATMPPELAERCIKAGCPKEGHVLDPFGGAGTTGLVADRLGRDATLIELNPTYCDLQRDRVVNDAPLFSQVEMQAALV